MLRNQAQYATIAVMQVLKFVFRNLDHFRARFLGLICLGFIHGITYFLIPTALAEFTKHPITTQSATQLIAIVAGLYIFDLCNSWVIRNHGEALIFQFSNYIREKLFKRYEHLTTEQMHTHHSGYVLSLTNKVADKLDSILMGLMWNISAGFAVLLLFFYFTFKESPLLAIGNVAILTIFVVVSSRLARTMVPMAAEQNVRRATLLSSYADFMANIMTIKKLGIHPFAERKVRKQTARLDAQIRTVQRFHGNRWFMLHSLFGLAFVGTIGLLVWSISAGGVSPSILILFISAYGTLRGLVERLSEDIKDYMDTGAYLRQLDDILQQPTGVDQKKLKAWKTIELRDVAFTYKDGSHRVTIPNFTLHSGNKVCITGPSGQGKSTFLNLLTNQLTPQEGVRTINGHSFDEMSELLSQNTAVIAQDVDLFNVSVRENLTLGQTIVDDTLVVYIKAMGLQDWYKSLKHGLDTVVGEKGTTLSAGQKQRLNILRGLLLNRQIYILDEPTSHLDDATEKLVVDFLKRELKDKTVVVVTHRPALRDICDTEYVMNNHTLEPAKR